MVEPPDHDLSTLQLRCSDHTVKTCTWHIGFLRQRSADRGAHRAADRLGDRIRDRAARRAACELIALDHRVVDDPPDQVAVARPFPECRCSSISGSPTSSPLLGDRQRHRNDAGKAQPARGRRPCAPRPRPAARRPCRAARPAPRRRSPGAPGASRTRSPLRQVTTLHAGARAPARRARPDAAASPCTGMRICGLTQPIMSSSSARRGWPETCTRWVRSVMTSTPWSIRPLMMRVDRLLVARNGARGEDHAVAARERHLRMLRPRRCATAPRAARPGCRCRAPPPCRAADSRRCRRERKSCMPSR